MSLVRLIPVIQNAIDTIIATISNPLVAGPALYVLTRGPEDAIRNRLVEQVAQLPVKIDLELVATALKALLALNIAGRVQKYLNLISQNDWALTAPTADWKWDQEVAVVTGGSAGIGEQTVLRLLRKNIKVAVLDISPPSKTISENPNAHYFKTDVTSEAVVKEVAAAVKAKLGPPTILINNAGIGSSKLLLDNDEKWLHKIFGVNLFAHFYTCKAFLPDMVKRNHGHIVTIASTASFITLPTIVDYAATKAGVLSFHEGLKREIIHAYKAPKVLTSIVHPNWTRTALIQKEADNIEKNQGPLLTPEKVADAIVNQIFSCRGAQVILPAHFNLLSTVKAWPNWNQEALRGLLGKQTVDKIVDDNVRRS